MIDKIKSLIKTKEHIDKINKNIEDNSKIVLDLKESLNDLKDNFASNIKEMRKEQEEFSKNLNDNIDMIKSVREDFGKELYEFKMLKAQMQRKILDKFEEELQKDLNLNRELLKKDTQDYNDLRKKVSEVASKLNLTGEEINKFIDISKSIKKGDFELTNHARNLSEMDKEKLELMRKIDTLEKLVSKIRRREMVR